MNESILLIIKYLLKKKCVIIDDDSFDSFFCNGTSFPTFIAKMLNLVSIPQIKQNPASKYDCEYNNNEAFQLFLQYYPNIKSQNPQFKTLEDRAQLLKLILVTECFHEDTTSLIKKLNLTLNPLQINISTEKDLYNFKNISALLNIFTDGIFPITESFQIIYQFCSKTEIPLVIKEDSLANQNLYIFRIQIQIFFDFFSGCGNQILESIKEQLQQTKIASNSSNNSTNQTEQKIKPPEEQNSKKNKAINFWNHSPNIYSYFNGVLVLKTLGDSYYDLKIDQTIEFGLKNNMCQIFKFNEASYRWIFCEESFEKFFIDQDEDPIVPLVLFIDSNFATFFHVLNYYKKDFSEFDFGDEISVFIFRQESQEESHQKMNFLFVHVPYTKIYLPNIRSILFQIYTFLFIISDINLVFCSAIYIDSSISQVNFLGDIIKISNMYLKEAKKADGQKIFLDHSQIFFYMTTLSIPLYNVNLPSLLQEIPCPFEKEISEVIKKKYKIYPSPSIENVKKSLYEANLNSYRYLHLKEAFLYSNEKFSEINELYVFTAINIRNDDQPEFIRSIINNRYDELLTDVKYRKIKRTIIDDLKKESEPFYPKCDINFSSIFENELLKKSLKTDKFNKENLINELKNASQKNIQEIDLKIKIDLNCSMDKIDIFTKGHKRFLQKKFFEIIKNNCKESPNLVYEKLIDVLQSQILEDNKILYKIYDKYIKQISNDNEIEKFEDANNRSGNYVVKEIEMTREIEVNIDSDDDLEKLVPQDF